MTQNGIVAACVSGQEREWFDLMLSKVHTTSVWQRCIKTFFIYSVPSLPHLHFSLALRIHNKILSFFYTFLWTRQENAHKDETHFSSSEPLNFFIKSRPKILLKDYETQKSFSFLLIKMLFAIIILSPFALMLADGTRKRLDCCLKDLCWIVVYTSVLPSSLAARSVITSL